MKLRDLLCGKSYWKTQSSVWYDEIRKVYRPHRMCVKCGQISRWATKYCPHCGRYMTHETIPTAYVPTKEVKVAPLNNRWIKLQKEEEDWAERLHRGVPVEEVRQREKAEKNRRTKMPRLIDANEILKSEHQHYDYRCDEYYVHVRDIENAPTVDAEPVRHGHWCVTQAYPHTVYCSECFQRFAQAHWAVWEDGSLPRNYCPHCGAKMDEAD